MLIWAPSSINPGFVPAWRQNTHYRSKRPIATTWTKKYRNYYIPKSKAMCRDFMSWENTGTLARFLGYRPRGARGNAPSYPKPRQRQGVVVAARQRGTRYYPGSGPSWRGKTPTSWLCCIDVSPSEYGAYKVVAWRTSLDLDLISLGWRRGNQRGICQGARRRSITAQGNTPIRIVCSFLLCIIIAYASYQPCFT